MPSEGDASVQGVAGRMRRAKAMHDAVTGAPEVWDELPESHEDWAQTADEYERLSAPSALSATESHAPQGERGVPLKVLHIAEAALKEHMREEDGLDGSAGWEALKEIGAVFNVHPTLGVLWRAYGAIETAIADEDGLDREEASEHLDEVREALATGYAPQREEASAERGEREEWLREYERRKLYYVEAVIDNPADADCRERALDEHIESALRSPASPQGEERDARAELMKVAADLVRLPCVEIPARDGDYLVRNSVVDAAMRVKKIALSLSRTDATPLDRERKTVHFKSGPHEVDAREFELVIAAIDAAVDACGKQHKTPPSRWEVDYDGIVSRLLTTTREAAPRERGEGGRP